MTQPERHARRQSTAPFLSLGPAGRRARALLPALLALAGLGRADVLTVDDDLVENPTATYTSLQAAIADAQPQDEVHIWPGTYTGTGTEVALVDVPGLLLAGQNASGPVVIDGQGQRRCLRVLGEGVDSYNSLDLPIHIQGLTLVNGEATSSTGGGYKGNGGGAYLEGYVWLQDCTIRDCNSSRSGGGLSIEQPSSWITSPVRYTAVKAISCTIESCTSTEDGGGIYNGDSILEALDVTVTDSYASGNGGGVAGSHHLNGSTEFRGSATWNRSERNGGGLHVEGLVGSLTVMGELGWNTARGGDGGGIFVADSWLWVRALTAYQNQAERRQIGAGGRGGALCVLRSTLDAITLTAYRNNSEADGGGLFLQDCDVKTLRDGTLEQNLSYGRGGAIALQSCSNANLEELAFLENLGRVASAVHAQSTQGVIGSCSFLGNAAYMNGGWSGAAVVGAASTTDITIAHSTFWQNTAKHLLEVNGAEIVDGGNNQLIP